MKHLLDTGQRLFFPTARNVMIVPQLVEDLTLAPLPEGFPSGDPDTDWGRWEVNWMIAVPGDSIFSLCLREARVSAARALPADGDLYARLYPRAGGNALDCHMAIVILALAMYEAARRTGVEHLRRLRLSEARALLEPAVAEKLRGIYPSIWNMPGLSHLRVTDERRLQTADPQEWERWRKAAYDIITYVIDDISTHHYVPSPITPEDVSVHHQAANWLHDDLTWYAGERLAARPIP
ncbi:hypothetical protein [Streptomyces sp. NPDC049555]|uniref:hypothetical protein n=1 Tax=Streptomyces sp. NPDC049555 TaxID=3154930 RepID=UPI00342223E5